MGDPESVPGPAPVQPSNEIDVLFVGKTGVGKSSLINMVRGVLDHTTGVAAEVSNDARPCTTKTASYSTTLESGLRCQLWDTRGLDEAADGHGGLRARIVDWIRQVASQQTRELRETLRDRTRLAVPILIWCIDAAKIDIPVQWEQFRKVYMDYCEGRAIPAVVITQMRPNQEIDWRKRCDDQLAALDFGGGSNKVEISLLRVRRYRTTPCHEYEEDSKALKDFIYDLVKR